MKKLFNLLLFVIMFSTAHAQEVPVWKIGKLEQHLKTADKPIIVNFWATFCKPCVEELPYFLKLAKKYDNAGLQLLLVSLDFSEAHPKARMYALKHNFAERMVLLDETNADLFCPKVDSSWSGAIPASLFLNNKTGYRKFYEAQMSPERLEKEIQSLLTSPNDGKGEVSEADRLRKTGAGG
ncbi:TlpA disulfide reductase family protein [Paraflavisolibacter sp. H34]|uniref:TlpA disulfide reductase family protein n=1 Tax=Huijunlia imazamoxiresistens TaxID=3127457 RepID=UPI0030168E65